MSKELKPCPFCGDAEDLTVTRINDSACYWCIECESCDYNRYIFGAKQEAIKIWNTRPAEEVLKAKVESLKAENDELRYIVEQFSKWTAEGGCVKANFPDFPCWWERNRIELQLDDYCDSEDEMEHKCWVEYYRWKFRQKNNNPNTGKGGYDE